MAFADNIAQFINKFVTDLSEAVSGILTSLANAAASLFYGT